MLLNRASRCFNNFHNVEVAFNASHLSSFSMLVPHNKQEQGCKVSDAFSFRAGQLTHVSKLFWRPLAWTSSHIFAIVSDRFRIIPKLANVNPLHIGEKQFVNLLGMTAYWSILVDIGRIHAYYMRLRRAWAAQKIQFRKLVTSRTDRSDKGPDLSSPLSLPLTLPLLITHPFTERLPAPKPKRQVWWISIS